MAIQQADKLLKKHRDLHCAKVSNLQSIPDFLCAPIGLLMFKNEEMYTSCLTCTTLAVYRMGIS